MLFSCRSLPSTCITSLADRSASYLHGVFACQLSTWCVFVLPYLTYASSERLCDTSDIYTPKSSLKSDEKTKSEQNYPDTPMRTLQIPRRHLTDILLGNEWSLDTCLLIIQEENPTVKPEHLPMIERICAELSFQNSSRSEKAFIEIASHSMRDTRTG